MKKLIVGISGASGVIYGIRLLEVVRPLASASRGLPFTTKRNTWFGRNALTIS